MRSAVDTNVLVRFLIDDGSDQVSIARRVFDRGTVFVPASVMLESEWVLRSAFRVSKLVICEAFVRILNMPTVTVEQADAMSKAVDAHRTGMDFADALHLFTSAECGVFYSFDIGLHRSAGQLSGIGEVRTPDHL